MVELTTDELYILVTRRKPESLEFRSWARVRMTSLRPPSSDEYLTNVTKTKADVHIGDHTIPLYDKVFEMMNSTSSAQCVVA